MARKYCLVGMLERLILVSVSFIFLCLLLFCYCLSCLSFSVCHYGIFEWRLWLALLAFLSLSVSCSWFTFVRLEWLSLSSCSYSYVLILSLRFMLATCSSVFGFSSYLLSSVSLFLSVGCCLSSLFFLFLDVMPIPLRPFWSCLPSLVSLLFCLVRMVTLRLEWLMWDVSFLSCRIIGMMIGMNESFGIVVDYFGRVFVGSLS